MSTVHTSQKFTAAVDVYLSTGVSANVTTSGTRRIMLTGESSESKQRAIERMRGDLLRAVKALEEAAVELDGGV